MTRQQLIDLIINAKRTDPETGSFVEYLADFLIGYGVTLAPTREQVERLRGEWLNFYNDFSTAECSKCGELFDVSDTDENLKMLFDAFRKYYRFCPACGAPMYDEALDILMERLEVLHD